MAALADGASGEEFPDEGDALLPVEPGSLLGAGPESRPTLEGSGSAHASRVGQGSRQRPPAGVADRGALRVSERAGRVMFGEVVPLEVAPGVL